MRKLAITLAFAVATTLSAGFVSQASADTIHIGPNGVRVTDHDHRHYGHRRHHYRHFRHHRRCHVRTVVKYRHHHRIVKRVRVCR